ncbi:hypothetical protein NM909_000742 [Staphylococcus pseudintermedius]|nr:hypothetical protein [Staphylococcus pseudintermedius]EIA4930219.1 hypothetical protein [Staphylococcus pseudintermedius]EIA5746980.1 hypothetical protein [Staphylococcus pseudintermedius]EIE3738481.1 hypothetical protein [Staphylococcus pseudintermedius]EII6294623.1 hypothetical protein [Staphylococcus pseudintermedius]EIQ3693828.1 hypothetical protein [Staphylococcus pseudintermedius]
MFVRTVQDANFAIPQMISVKVVKYIDNYDISNFIETANDDDSPGLIVL